MKGNVLEVEYHPEAAAELFDAKEWYAEQNITVSERFEQEVVLAESKAMSDPRRWSSYLLGTRIILLNGFPYGFVYTSQEDLVNIVAVAHLKRRPGYWEHRL